MSKATNLDLPKSSIKAAPLPQEAGISLSTNDSYASQIKGRTGLLRVLKAASYSGAGFKAAYQFEAAFRQVFWLNVAALSRENTMGTMISSGATASLALSLRLEVSFRADASSSPEPEDSFKCALETVPSGATKI